MKISYWLMKDNGSIGCSPAEPEIIVDLAQIAKVLPDCEDELLNLKGGLPYQIADALAVKFKRDVRFELRPGGTGYWRNYKRKNK